MYTLKTFNKISKKGLSLLPEASFTVDPDAKDPHAILLRSHNLHEHAFEESVLAVGRAGAGVNNIPIKDCTEKGIVVFNTPGANANAVKELVFSGMLLASRNIFAGLTYVNELRNQDVNIHQEVEKNKSKFKGFELKGKKLGVIGLGAIGVLVANDATSLGVDVHGFDPYISVDRAWGLSSDVKQASNLKKMLSEMDFITFHMPLNDSTRGFFDKEKLQSLKEGCIVLNFARPEIMNEVDLYDALDNNKIKKFVTDFPTNELLKRSNVIGLPHLGASTKEAEDNCSIMIAKQIKNYLETGNIVNAVNFPNCSLEPSGGHRIAIFNQNIPNMVGQVTAAVANEGLNIIEMVNKSRENIAYTLLDTTNEASDALIQTIRSIEGVTFVRRVY